MSFSPLSFDCTITFGTVVSTLSLLAAILLTWWQIRKANKQNRAQLVINILSGHVSDPETLAMLYKLEYNDFEFNEKTFPQSSEERALDKLLYSFEQISALYEMRTIRRKDLALIEYDFLRVYCNEEVQKYFAFLDRTPHGLPTDRADFHAYRRVAKQISDEFSRRGGRIVQSCSDKGQRITTA